MSGFIDEVITIYKTLEDVLEKGLSEFGLDMGIVSHIEDDKYTVHTCVSSGEGLATGTEFELRDTYCSDVVRTGKTCFYRDVAQITDMLKHPCYLNTQLRAYIGTPVFINGNIWGTLNYSSLFPHKEQYSEEEIRFIDAQARKVSELLTAG